MTKIFEGFSFTLYEDSFGNMFYKNSAGQEEILTYAEVQELHSALGYWMQDQEEMEDV